MELLVVLYVAVGFWVGVGFVVFTEHTSDHQNKIAVYPVLVMFFWLPLLISLIQIFLGVALHHFWKSRDKKSDARSL